MTFNITQLQIGLEITLFSKLEHFKYIVLIPYFIVMFIGSVTVNIIGKRLDELVYV